MVSDREHHKRWEQLIYAHFSHPSTHAVSPFRLPVSLDTSPMECQPAVTLAERGKNRSSNREAARYAEFGVGS